MSKTTLGILIGLISVLSIAGIVYATMPEKSSNRTVNNASATAESEPISNPQQPLTKDEIAKHNNEDDCWTIINGNVYDITEYVPRHPGGDEILRACGTDGSGLFNTRKTESGEEVGSGTPHSSGARSTLERYQVGILSD